MYGKIRKIAAAASAAAVMLTGTAAVLQTGAAAEPAEITLVPYFAWNNRGEGEMRVWLHPIPEVK